MWYFGLFWLLHFLCNYCVHCRVTEMERRILMKIYEKSKDVSFQIRHSCKELPFLVFTIFSSKCNIQTWTLNSECRFSETTSCYCNKLETVNFIIILECPSKKSGIYSTRFKINEICHLATKVTWKPISQCDTVIMSWKKFWRL